MCSLENRFSCIHFYLMVAILPREPTWCDIRIYSLLTFTGRAVIREFRQLCWMVRSVIVVIKRDRVQVVWSFSSHVAYVIFYASIPVSKDVLTNTHTGDSFVFDHSWHVLHFVSYFVAVVKQNMDVPTFNWGNLASVIKVIGPTSKNTVTNCNGFNVSLFSYSINEKRK